MENIVDSIVIVGGGTAGWLTAGLLVAKHNNPEQPITVTLIESPSVKPISVGEGTWPTMKKTLQTIGISETEFINECNVAFKQSSCFVGWNNGSQEDVYFHPFSLPEQFSSMNLANHWLKHSDKVSFSNAVSFQESLCRKGLAPKQITSPEFQGVANYGYHLDSAKFSAFLKKFCIEKKGINFISDDMIAVKSADNGDISAIVTKNNGDISGDLFIDCTGFKSLLIGEHFNIPFISKSDQLFANNALALQQDYESAETPINCYTISASQSAGWIWDIGLQTRRGMGYVYSSDYISEDEATDTLLNYAGIKKSKKSAAQVRKIPIKSGHRETFWHKNCVAVGLSAGFLEPLEASALVMIELSVTHISEQLPENRAVMDVVAKRFNEAFTYKWDRIIDFLKLHYVLSNRKEKFWQDNRDPASIPENLQELLTLWQYQTPWRHDFIQSNEIFSSASYQYILYGANFKTQTRSSMITPEEIVMAEAAFNQNAKLTQKMMSVLPNHRELINKIKQFGLSKI